MSVYGVFTNALGPICDQMQEKAALGMGNVGLAAQKESQPGL